MASKKQAAINVSNIDLEVDVERLEHDLANAKDFNAKDKILKRFLDRASSQTKTNIKTRDIPQPKIPQLNGGKKAGKLPQPDTPLKRGGKVSRKRGGKIMQGYKAGGKI